MTPSISQTAWTRTEDLIEAIRSITADAMGDWGFAGLAALVGVLSLMCLTAWLQKELDYWLQDPDTSHQILAPRILWAILGGCLGLLLVRLSVLGSQPPNIWQAMALGFWSSAMLLSALIDLRSRLLPDRMTLAIALLGLGLAVFGQFVALEQALMGGLLGYAIPWATNQWAMRSGQLASEAIGRGDMALLGGIGLWLGPSGVVTVLLASSILLLLTAGVYRLLIFTRRRLVPSGPSARPQQGMPMGPAIAGCAWLGPIGLLQWPDGLDLLSIVADFAT